MWQCVHAQVFDFCHDWTKISDDGDKGVQICISLTFIELSVCQGIKVWQCINAGCTLVDTNGRIDRRNPPVPLICF